MTYVAPNYFLKCVGFGMIDISINKMRRSTISADHYDRVFCNTENKCFPLDCIRISLNLNELHFRHMCICKQYQKCYVLLQI